jgi:alkylation response protein AidB-like acyl-CoA dehydrogenase
MRGYDLAFSRELGARGLLGVSWPTVYGGQGLSAAARLAITEELLRVGAPVAAHWIGERQIGPSILRYGTSRLKTLILPGIARADITFCLGMSETEAGSDLAAVRTRAVRGEAGWMLTGAKVWTTQAHRSTHMYVLARTAVDTPRHGGLTEFVVDMCDERVHIRPILDLAGEHHFNEVVLDQVCVPDHMVIGEVGQGWSQVVDQLSFERGGAERYLSTYPLLSRLIESVRRSPDRAAIERVGSLMSRLISLRRFARSIAADIDAGLSPTVAAAELKLLGTDFEKEVVEVARYVLDVTDAPASDRSMLAEAVLCVPGGSIRGGVSEVLLSLIARSGTTR